MAIANATVFEEEDQWDKFVMGDLDAVEADQDDDCKCCGAYSAVWESDRTLSHVINCQNGVKRGQNGGYKLLARMAVLPPGGADSIAKRG
jgi:hypothetical protein